MYSFDYVVIDCQTVYKLDTIFLLVYKQTARNDSPTVAGRPPPLFREDSRTRMKRE